jgi:predicted nucleic acid-binding protein
VKAFVLDCSATVPWIFGSEANRDSAALLEVLVTGGTAWVPALWHLELANVLLGAQRRGRIEPAGIAAFLGALAAFEIEVDPETMDAAWSRTLALAGQYGLSIYDAAYLELALRRGLPLATRDRPLAEALRQAGGKTVPA